jgi:hypothetical protein
LRSGAVRALRDIGGSRPLERSVAVVVFGCALIYATLSARFWGRMNAPLHFDDGYVAAVAARLIQGRFLPYVDVASHRGLGFYWLAGIAQALGGWTEWVGIRWLASGGFVLTVVTLFVAGIAARKELAGAVATLLFTYLNVCVLETETVFGMVSEPFASAFSLLALLTAAAGLCRTHGFAARAALMAACGVLSALAGVTKQTYLPVIGPFALWAAAFAFSEPEWSPRRGLGLVLALLGGWLLPLIAILTVYGGAGQLSAFVYWFVTYNQKVYMGPYGPGSFERELRGWLATHGTIALALVVVLLAALQRVAPQILRSGRPILVAYRGVAFEATCLWQAVLAIIGTVMPLRFWSQYELPPVPWVALLVGLGFERWCELGWSMERSAIKRASGALVTGLVLVGFTAPLMDDRLETWREQRANGQWRSARPDSLCEVVDTYARHDEPIFIWGFDGVDIYVTCKHPPASRYVYMTSVAGIVPGFWDKPSSRYVAPHAREDLLADLTRTRPPVILDYPGRLGNFHITRVRSFEQLLDRDYCSRGESVSRNGRHFGVYVRKDRCP